MDANIPCDLRHRQHIAFHESLMDSINLTTDTGLDLGEVRHHPLISTNSRLSMDVLWYLTTQPHQNATRVNLEDAPAAFQ